MVKNQCLLNYNVRTEIKVPNIGDFKDVEVIEVLVSEGQTLKKMIL
jgi:pyruvate dehydrogenase E2 component (dihydrolipoamide acetyltransferase)